MQKWGFMSLMAMGVCLTRGYYSSVADCRHFTGEDATSSSTAAGARAIDGGVLHGAGGERTVKPRKDDLQQLRHQCVNTLHLQCEILSCRQSRALLVGLTALIQPLEIKHNSDITLMSTEMGRVEYNIQRSAGEDLGFLTDMAACFKSRELLYSMGVSTYNPAAISTTLPKAVATMTMESLLGFFCNLASMEIAYSLHFTTCFPGLLFCQLHRSQGVRDAGMALMRMLFEKVTELESRASEDLWVPLQSPAKKQRRQTDYNSFGGAVHLWQSGLPATDPWPVCMIEIPSLRQYVAFAPPASTTAATTGDSTFMTY